MPTLIRLVITLLFLAGLVYAGMFALVVFVEPTPKQVTIRIPARDLLNESAPALPGLPAATPAPAPAPLTDESPAALAIPPE